MTKINNRQYAVNITGEPVRTPTGDAFSALAVRVLRLNGLLTAAGDAIARPIGQTSARWWVLASLQTAPATVAQVARTLRLARQSVQRVADLLVRDGLAVYEDNPRHRRAKLLTLTDFGRSRLSLIQANQRVWANAIGAELGARELGEANELLDRIARAVESNAPLPRASPLRRSAGGPRKPAQ
jgi:DNA-binding MarR family transcriptional regulator